MSLIRGALAPRRDADPHHPVKCQQVKVKMGGNTTSPGCLDKSTIFFFPSLVQLSPCVDEETKNIFITEDSINANNFCVNIIVLTATPPTHPIDPVSSGFFSLKNYHQSAEEKNKTKQINQLYCAL